MNIAFWLKRGGLVTAPAVVAATALAAAANLRPVWTQAATEGQMPEELQRGIRERDAAIGDLMRRVEELERRLAATAVEQPPPAGAAPASALPPTEPEHERPVVTKEGRDEEPVEEEAVERALERALVQTGALLPAGAVEIAAGLNDAHSENGASRLAIHAAAQRVKQLEWQTSTPSSAAPPVVAAKPPALAETAVAQAEPGPEVPGPAALGEFEVDEEAVERALERALVQTGALLLPAGTIEVDPGFSYVRREDDTLVALIEDGQLLPAVNERRQNELEAGLTLRLGLPFDSQLEAQIPYSYKEISDVTEVGFTARGEGSRDGAGLGDIRLSFAKGLLRERGWRPDLIARVQWDSDTGRSDDGLELGSGFHEITGSLTAVKRQDPLVFVGGLAYTHAFEDSDLQPGAQLGFSLGTVLAASPETSLRFFLTQAFANQLEVGGRKIEGTDQVSTSLILGASSIIAPRALLDMTVGIGLTEDAPDYTITVSLPVRFDLPVF